MTLECPAIELHRIAAFTDATDGGNAAGVALCATLPDDDAMLAIAADVGYSDTAFLQAKSDAWGVRFFAPAAEVAFCGLAA